MLETIMSIISLGQRGASSTVWGTRHDVRLDLDAGDTPLGVSESRAAFMTLHANISRSFPNAF